MGKDLLLLHEVEIVGEDLLEPGSQRALKRWNDDRKEKRKMAREEECQNAGQAQEANLLSCCTLEGKAQATGCFCGGSPDRGKM